MAKAVDLEDKTITPNKIHNYGTFRAISSSSNSNSNLNSIINSNSNSYPYSNSISQLNSDLISHINSNLNSDSNLNINLSLDVNSNLSDSEKKLRRDFGKEVPHMKILIMVVGTWGDVQPFVALGLELSNSCGHFVRLATNSIYEDFVKKNGLEFFPLGGDPEYLSAALVENSGLIPSHFSDLNRQRNEYRKIIFSTWPACREPSKENNNPFVPDAIISNPPASGFLHCAEKLGIPVHLAFTMPWSPTKAYPHPFSHVTYVPGRKSTLNLVSYYGTEIMLNIGVMDIINDFRKSIDLDPILISDGSLTMLNRLKIPFFFAWSPSLVPKPEDWGNNIDVVGFMSMKNSMKNFDPPTNVLKFLESGEPPVYIGFGSMQVKDPKKLTELIFSVLKKTGFRAIVSQGWAKLGVFPGVEIPQNVLLVENISHKWLFPKCFAVVHHGGAGTVATGLEAGLPTMVVPFFGDQYFWGNLIYEKGVGPLPVPLKNLNEDIFFFGLHFLRRPEVQFSAKKLSFILHQEKGVEGGVEAFYRHLPVEKIICDVDKTKTAHVYCTECKLKLSEKADQDLHPIEIISKSSHIRVPYRPIDWSSKIYRQPWHSFSLGFGKFVREIGSAGVELVTEPFSECKNEGIKGVPKGVLRGVKGFFSRSGKGFSFFWEGVEKGLKEMREYSPKPWDSPQKKRGFWGGGMEESGKRGGGKVLEDERNNNSEEINRNFKNSNFEKKKSPMDLRKENLVKCDMEQVNKDFLVRDQGKEFFREFPIFVYD